MVLTSAVSRVIATEGTDAILPCSPSTRENLEKEWFDWKKVGQGGETLHNVFSYDETGARYEHYIDPILKDRSEENVQGAASKPYVTILEETKDWSLLQCEVHGASPKPLLQWKDSSGNILPADEPQVSERGGSYDVILNATVKTTGRYHCVATQEETKHQTNPTHIFVSLGGASTARVGVVLLFSLLLSSSLYL
ncbi:butyrophilin-like protein 1 [Eleginops maclovinus]|uniref:butyrophilin-like protein 1 n=1 Tax=Eleginops maclovinus TaxID=56733 RepID=UPI003080E863